MIATFSGKARLLVAMVLSASLLSGCANMNETQQRALTGTAGGATVGAIFGAIGGNAGMGALVGAGAGLAGGLIYDHVKKSEQSSYQQGYTAGRQHIPPQPPQ
jgi:uncharacterized protein YcfJ